MLSRDALIKLAEEDYFVGCNNHDLDTVLATMSDDCVMRFSAARYQYTGASAMRTHFMDFLSNFPTINFHNFVTVADVETQSVSSHFTVTLIDKDDTKLEMHNCNFFTANKDGIFNDVLIFNAAPLKEGFQAGSS